MSGGLTPREKLISMHAQLLVLSETGFHHIAIFYSMPTQLQQQQLIIGNWFSPGHDISECCDLDAFSCFGILSVLRLLLE